MPQWPEAKLPGDPASQASLEPPPYNRPSTVIEFLSDLTRHPKQALTFVMIVGSILTIAVACGGSAITIAPKEIKGIPLHSILSAGFGGATLLTFAITMVVRCARKHRKGAQNDSADI